MKKLLILVGIIFMGFTLSACQETAPELSPPSFVSFLVDGQQAKTGGEFQDFYKPKNGLIEVDLTLSNPSNVTITSIVINGRNYRVDIFKAGSTNSSIKFDLDVGTKTGETIFSIDQIKFSNGDTTEKVDITTANEFAVYVYKDVPVVERNDYTLNQNSISVDFSIEDEDDVIITDTLIAQLFSGEVLVEERIIETGDINVTFEGLLTSQTYDFKVKANYDIDNNEGMKSDIDLYYDQFTTLSRTIPSAQILNVNVTSNNVLFDITFSDADGVLEENGLSVGLYQDDTLIEEKPLNGSTTSISFQNLLNDNEYSIKLLADLDLEDGQGVSENVVLANGVFTTLPRIIPLPEIINLNIEENRVFFDVDIDDPFELLIEGSLIANVYLEDELIESTPVINNTVDFQIVNLFANKLFTVEITGSYDLNDGEGLQEDQVIFNASYTTLINEVPRVLVDEINVTQGYVILDLIVTDPNETLKGDVVAVLYENEVPVATKFLTTDDEELIFEYLVTYTEVYNIEISADYNLRDGVGTYFDEILFSSIIVTVEQKAPATEIHNLVTTNEGLSFDVLVMDADETIENDEVTVYLYHNDVIVNQATVGIGTTFVQFDNLLSDNEYHIVVEADYNLNDGTGIQEDQELIDVSTMTLEKELPTADLIDFENDNGSITVDIIINDEDNVIVDGTIKALLYKDGIATGDEIVLINGANPDVTFSGLLSANAYQVKVEVSYDLNDGNPQIDNYELADGTDVTRQNNLPSASAVVISENQQSVVLDIIIFDEDGVITGDRYATIYVNDVQVGLPIELTDGLNSNVTFNGIFSNTRFVVEVTADYDLNDGETAEDDALLALASVQTLANIAPTAEIDNVVLGKDTITFDVTVVDVDDTITENLLAVLYKDGTTTGQSLPLFAGENLAEEFTGLLADSTYVVVIVTDYSLKTQAPEIDGALLDSYQAITEPLDNPSAAITITNTYNTKIEFDVTITDADNTITNNLKAVLYDGDTPTGAEVSLSPGANAGEFFDGLSFGKSYTIKVVTDYNLNNDQPDITGALLAEEDATTDSIIIIDNFSEVKRNTDDHADYDPSEVFVLMDVVVDDEFGILTGTPLEFKVYDSDDVQVGSSLYFYGDFNLEMVNLYFGNDYYYTIEAEYDLGEGAGVQTEIVYTAEFSTAALVLAEMVISNLRVSGTNIEFEINGITDEDGIIVSNFEVILVLDDDTVTPEATAGLILGDNDINFVVDGTQDATYDIIIRADVDFRDGEGLQTDYEITIKTVVYTN